MDFDKLWEKARPYLLAGTLATGLITFCVPRAEAHDIIVVGVHTKETASVDLDDLDDLRMLDAIARDWRQGTKCTIDRKTISWLHDIIRKLKLTRPTIEIISGYRTPATNAKVGGKSKSQHMVCKALDFRIVGVDTNTLADAARATQQGGLGVYRGSRFIHIDSGRVRRW